MKRFITFCLCLSFLYTHAQSIDGNPVSGIISSLKKSKSDSSKVSLMLVMGEQYLLRIGYLKADVDSAKSYARRAQEFSRSINYEQGYSDAILLMAKTYLEEINPQGVVNMLRMQQQDLTYIRLLLLLGTYYMEKPGIVELDMDSALILIQQASDLSQKMHAQKWHNESLRTLGRFYLETGDIAKGKEYFVRAINDLHKDGQYFDEANFWIDLGYRIPDSDHNFDEKINDLTKAVQLFHDLKMTDKEAWSVRARAEIYRRQGRLNLAETELQRVLKLQQETGLRNLYETYNILTEINMYRGDFSKALHYSLLSVKSMQETGDTIYIGYVYEHLGNIYHELGEPVKSIEWYKRAAGSFIAPDAKEQFLRINILYATELIALQKPQEALALLQTTQKSYHTVEPLNKQILAGGLAASYQALKQYDIAEKYYMDMIAWEHILKSGNQLSANAYYAIGKFYLEIKQYGKAASYLDTALINAPGRVPVSRIKDIHLLLFSADSSLNKYPLAISHLQSFQRLNDSIFNDNKIKQFEELQVKYETSEKEKDIKLLRHEVRQAAQIRRFTYGSIVMLLLLLALGYNRYRSKQQNNKQMEAKQKEITEKNNSLQLLVKEKEWLVREIHHRVKNNLQIIMSLLSAQSDYLVNETALKAIKESGQRMQAISLIHQKLYLPGNPEMVEMQVYIRELVSYLKDGYAGIGRIYFDLRIIDIKLNVSQAVSVGLILNEAVTNAIKYAFPENSTGSIVVSLAYTAPGQLLLTIADSGRGLPENVDFGRSDSLGIKLIETFSRQLDGELIVDKTDGLMIKLSFKEYEDINS